MVPENLLFQKKIQNAYKNEVTLLPCDNYYLPHDDISYEERTYLNYDAPEALDFQLMTEHVHTLKEGKSIQCPVYDFTQHNRSKETILIEPSEILILDGILLYAHKELRNLIDLKIYVDTDADERILRRASRDILERGRTIDSVIDQYITTVKPMHYIHVEPTKAIADIVVNGGMNCVALNLVTNKISSILSKNTSKE